ncbi:MAG: hypothetical protein A3H91_11755 [Gammaproteobacteria bacterium RIFCSPLOWO2_02_FULL_61_13]|nr:MAG: hypothetical protein A3H91_11755 [Gammaproteobacteria bacterium RIFCSPLOWO2_02_FULL_61_13]
MTGNIHVYVYFAAFLGILLTIRAMQKGKQEGSQENATVRMFRISLASFGIGGGVVYPHCTGGTFSIWC